MKTSKKSAGGATDEEYRFLMTSLDASVSKHLLDEHFTVVWANDRYYEMFGYTKEEYETLYHNQCDLFFKNYRHFWDDLVDYVGRNFSPQSKKYEYICRMPHKSGKLLWIKLTGNFTDEIVEGYPVSYSVMMDITEQMQIQQERSFTYSSMPGLIAKFVVTQEGYRLINANKKYYDLLTDREFISLDSIAVNEGLETLARLFPKLRNGESVSGEIHPRNREGKLLHLKISGSCIDWECGNPVYLVVYDDITQITEQQELLRAQNAELERIAYEDPVTGGMNRMRFEILAQETLDRASAGSFALVWVNMDKFKLVNDMAGKALGNQTLKYVWRFLSEDLEQNEYVARIAADNFILLLHNDTDVAIDARLNGIAKKINAFNDFRKNRYFLSFTAGIRRADGSETDVSQLSEHANIARKEIRKNEYTVALCSCRFYSEQERERLVNEKKIENKMRDALEQRQFEIYLQPKLDLKRNVVSGAEALVRWNDPEKGMITPGEFIPIFEKNGFIIDLDRFVFKEVCKLIRSWLDRGVEPVPVSVNVSRIHFSSPDFVSGYAEICESQGVSTRFLEIEVTETVALEDAELFMKIVRELHERGFACSLDDFGSGYSSLNVLKDIDVDTLKLDKAFFASPEMNNVKEREVIASVIDLAKRLNMLSLAEGIETDTQQKFLFSRGCDQIQGFVFSRPLPAKEFEKLVYRR